LICCSSVMITQHAALAQGLLGGTSSDITLPFSSKLWGKSSDCGSNATNNSLGLLSTDYKYRSLSIGDGVRFSELSLNYYLPVFMDSNTFLTPFAIAYVNNVKDSTQALGLADAMLRFGGVLRTKLNSDLWGGVGGEYDSVRRLGNWYSGGQARIELFQFIGRNLASLRVQYYSESAGDQPVTTNNSTGYEITLGYSQDIFQNGPRLLLAASGYESGSGSPDKLRGWFVRAGLSMAQGLLTLKGGAGHDSLVLNNYWVGASVNLLF